MQKAVTFGALTALFFVFAPATRGQTTEEVERLRRENELLKKEIELLKKEIELLKQEARAKPVGTDGPKSEEKPRTKAWELGSVEYELAKCVRNPKERTRVTFTFAVRCEKGDVQTVHGCKKLTLTTGDGSVLDGKVVSISNGMVTLTKGEWTRFQVTYEGVDKDVPSFDEVELTMGSPFGFPRAPLKFHRIKIEPK